MLGETRQFYSVPGQVLSGDITEQPMLSATGAFTANQYHTHLLSKHPMEKCAQGTSTQFCSLVIDSLKNRGLRCDLEEQPSGS